MILICLRENGPPIGGWNGTSVDTSKKFSGTFDGNNKVIRGLRIGTEQMPDSRYKYVGLFGNGGNITDTGVENVEIYSSFNLGIYAGGLAGAANTMINCYATGSISGSGDSSSASYVGGLVGSGSTITNCYATGSVSYYDYIYTYVGGLAGQGFTVTNCYATGDVSGIGLSYVYVGGLLGRGSKVTNSYATGKVTGGGLIGYLEGTITDGYWNKDTNDRGVESLYSDRIDTSIGKTTAELKTQAFVDLLNEGSTLESAMWVMDTSNKNQGFPVLTSLVPNPIKYWLGNTMPVTEKNGVYEITSAQQLAWISLQVSNGNLFVGKTVKLLNNIDLSGKQWTPIGHNASGWKGHYSGSFDGNFKKIIGMTIGTEQNPSNEYEDGYRSVGLFASLYSADDYNRPIIKNVGLENVQINCNATRIGALVGEVLSINKISNCYSTGIIKSTYITSLGVDGAAGGLVGYGSGQGTVSNCYSMIDISCSGKLKLDTGGYKSEQDMI